MNCASKVGVSEAVIRKWMLSISTLLATEDNSILDALLLYKSSLDKHFEGIEVCPICYSLFHQAGILVFDFNLANFALSSQIKLFQISLAKLAKTNSTQLAW